MKTAKNKTIIRSAAFALIALATLAMSQTAEAYVLNGNAWPGSKPRIPFYISTSLQGNVPYDAPFNNAVTAINNAATEWNTNGGSEFKFHYAGTTTVNQVADDGVNAIIYRNVTCPYFTPCNAYVTYHSSGGVFRGFDIEIFKYRGGGTTLVNWSAKPGTILWPWESDVQTVILHELGHALGLDHIWQTGSVMSTDCGTGCLRRALTTDDTNGAVYLYDSYTNEGLVASTTTPQMGQPFTLTLDYPLAAGKVYVVLASLEQGDIPLYQLSPTDGRMVFIDRNLFPAEALPSIFQNFVGVLDANGQGVATVNVPYIPGLQGLQMFFSVITLDPTNLTGIEDLGVNVQITLQ